MDVLCKLHNSLLETIAVIGLDESTVFVPSDPEVLSEQPNSISIVSLSPQVLAAVSGRVAIFPPISQVPDSTYPPIARKSPDSLLKKSPSILSNGNVIRAKASRSKDKDTVAALKRTFTRRFSCRQVDFVKNAGRKTFVNTNELPLNVETLTSLTKLCFPDDCYVSTGPCPDTLHYLVLTDIVGTRTYAVSLSTYTKRHVFKDSDGFWRCSPALSSDTEAELKDKQIAYVPQCYVFISQSPYFTVMKDCLSRLVQRLKENREEWRHLLKEFALHLSMIPLPPAGCVSVQFHLSQNTLVTIPPPSGQGRLPVDFNLGIVFQCLDSQTVLLVTTAILTQQRILFMSSSYVVLTLVIESFIHFLYPFQWNFTCVPILPLSLLELAEAPGTFIMGCHLRHRQLIEDIKGLVVVNLDNGTAIPCSSIDFPLLPIDAVKAFKSAIRRTITPVEVWRLERPSTFSYEESRAAELAEQRRLNTELSSIFLELMVDLFRNVLRHISPEKRFFHREQFLEAVGEHDLPFYEQVLNTDLFAVFLKERLDRKHDLWMDFILHNRPLGHGSIAGSIPLSKERPWVRSTDIPRAFSLDSGFSSMAADLEKSVSKAGKECTYLKIPNFMYGLSHLFLDNCYQEVSYAVTKSSPESTALSTYLYLRGMLSAARLKKINALEDFCSLATINHKLFPIEFVLEMLSLMNETERADLESSTLYKTSAILRDVQALKTNCQFQHDEPIVMELHQIPEKNINLQGFTELLEMLGICNDEETAERLFHGLTLDQTEVVDPLTFEEFYKCWKENEVRVHRTTQHLGLSDCVLKVSDLVKCCYGMGHVLLTQNGLLYMEEGCDKVRPVVNFTDVKSIEKVQQQSFFNKQMGIKIQRTDKREKFSMSFREHTEKWYLLLHELWAGKRLFEETKDPVVLHLTMQNVLIVDAYLQSGESEISSHYRMSKEMSPSLCYFMAKAGSQAPCTNELLVCRFDPNANEPQRSAVESVLYTDGYESRHDDAAVTVCARIWCGMASGAVQVFNLETSFLEHRLTPTPSEVKCLLSCHEREVWAGSSDTMIYVIENLPQLACRQVLDGHSDKVVAFTLSSDSRFVYSAARNGKILTWNSETKVKVNEIDVTDKILHKILYYNDRLWCCTNDELLSMSCDGSIISRLSYQETVSAQSHQECFAITTKNEVWIGCDHKAQVHVYDLDSLQRKSTIFIQSQGVTTIVCLQNKVWIGSKEGVLRIFDADTCILDFETVAHSGAIHSASVGAGQQQLVTGSGHNDGKVAIWQWPPSSTNKPSYK